MLTVCISATRHLPGNVCAGKRALTDLSSFPACQKVCAIPAPIDRPSSMLPPVAFLLQACLCAPFSPSSFYLRTSIFSAIPPPAATLHSPCLPPTLSSPLSPFLFCFSQLRGRSSCPLADQGGGTGIKERHDPWAAGPGAAELL